MRLLYVSWFRKVGDESYHHPHVHTGAYSDGEGGEEQSPSGSDVGQREVTFVHCLGGLKRRKCKRRRKSDTVWRHLKRKSDPFFKRTVITETVYYFCGGVKKKKELQFEDGPIDQRSPGELIVHGRTKKWQLV